MVCPGVPPSRQPMPSPCLWFLCCYIETLAPALGDDGRLPPLMGPSKHLAALRVSALLAVSLRYKSHTVQFTHRQCDSVALVLTGLCSRHPSPEVLYPSPYLPNPPSPPPSGSQQPLSRF